MRTLARPEQYGTRSETSTPVALVGHDVARVLERIADTLRPHCGRISESDLDRLATQIFQASAEFVLTWVEG